MWHGRILNGHDLKMQHGDDLIVVEGMEGKCIFFARFDSLSMFKGVQQFHITVHEPLFKGIQHFNITVRKPLFRTLTSCLFI